MPFSAGSYGAPVSSWNPAVALTAISPTDWNALLSDLSTALSTTLLKDGTQTATARIPFALGIQTDSILELTSLAGVAIAKLQSSQGADIASATGAGTLNLETATGQIVDVTGTTTLTAITLSQGHWRWVRFTGALLLTNGASLVIPGGANYTTAAGDYFLFVGYASGIVRVAAYALASGSSLATSSTAVTAASTFGTDNSILRADGTSRGAQSSGATATIDDNGNLTLTSTDAGATAAPVETLDRNSASPAASDVLGSWVGSGRNSAAATKTYASAQAEIVDPVSTTEDGLWNWFTIIAGALATRMKLGAGLFMAGATGGDQGVGTINATGFYTNGVLFAAVNDLLLYQDQKASGTTGGTYTASSWQAVPLNTEVIDTAGIGSLSANAVTLPAGSYEFEAFIESGNPAAGANRRARLRNTTDSTTIVQGTNATQDDNSTGATMQYVTPVIGSFVLASAKAVQLQLWTSQNTSAIGAASTGEVEVYATFKLRRYAT